MYNPLLECWWRSKGRFLKIVLEIGGGGICEILSGDYETLAKAWCSHGKGDKRYGKMSGKRNLEGQSYTTYMWESVRDTLMQNIRYSVSRRHKCSGVDGFLM